MKTSFLLRTLFVTLCVGQSAAFLGRFFSRGDDLDITEVAVRAGLDTLVDFVSLADEALAPILDRLTGDTPTTVFAPTDGAFRALPEATKALLEGDPSVLADVLLYHVIDGKVEAGDIPEDPTDVDTLLGESVTVEKVNLGPICFSFFCPQTVQVNKSKVIIKDIEATNGVIHIIDKVLMPPGIALADIVGVAVANGLGLLVAAVGAADLAETLQGDGPFTVFAPSNAAFGDLPAGLLDALLEDEGIPTLTDILLYHVVIGSAVASTDITSGATVSTALTGESLTLSVVEEDIFVQDSTGIDAEVIVADVVATNGVVHVIDKVLIPSSVDVIGDIVDVIEEDESLSSLVATLDSVDLLGALDTKGPWTLLAPTNDAFAALGDTSGLSDRELRDILLYHVLEGKIESSLIGVLGSAQTLNGGIVDISVQGSDIFINQAQVIVTDIPASNGVIHKIDAVLDPPEQQCRFFDFVCAVLEFFGFF